MSVEIRDARLDDVEIICKLYAEATAEGHFLPLYVTNQAFFQNCIEHKRISINSSFGPYTTAVSVKVATADGAVVGFSTGKGFMHPKAIGVKGSTEALGRELWLLAVSSNQRKKGIGTVLLNSQFQTMLRWKNKDKGVYARCLPRSTTAMRMLVSLGFGKMAMNMGETLFKFTPRS